MTDIVKGEDSLTRYIAEVRSIWGDGKDPQLPHKLKALVEQLLKSTRPLEPWITSLIGEGPPEKELYRDKEHGFVQLGHLRQKGHRTVPHDHGPCWMIHGVYHGATEITVYKRTDGGKISGHATLQKKETKRLTQGEVIEYLPGEIHSTFVPEPSVIFIISSGDLRRVQRCRYTFTGVDFRVEQVGPIAA